MPLSPAAEAFILPRSLASDACQAQNGYLFLLLPGLSGEVLAIKDSPGAADFLRLASAMIQAIARTHGEDAGLNSALKRLLEGSLSPAEQASLTRQHQFVPSLPRCVMLITLKKAPGGNIREMLESILPLQESDVLVSIDACTAALIRSMKGAGAEELGEYAAAIQDTIMNELGQQAVICLGETVPVLSALPLSFSQASAALLLSRVYPQESGVYDYHGLMLERFVMQTPQETAARFYPLLFNRETAKLLNEDMLNTITIFLDKNLNLSDASGAVHPPEHPGLPPGQGAEAPGA